MVGVGRIIVGVGGVGGSRGDFMYNQNRCDLRNELKWNRNDLKSSRSDCDLPEINQNNLKSTRID